MKVDGMLGGLEFDEVIRTVRELEELGYDGAFTAETSHDPFLPLAIAAEHTDRIQLGTSIAVAFARNPMTLANIGHDLQVLSKGRFVLGLGSQIKPHIEKRFSMPWSHPAARPLSVLGLSYRYRLMTPLFQPGASPYGPPKVFLAAVGELMTEVAGEVADGLLLHGFTTERYVREVTLPALERGLKRAGKQRSDIELAGPLFVITGENEEAMAAAVDGAKR